MERTRLRRQVALTRQSLFDQGFLDEQFIQLEDLQDDANPNFVEEVVTLYYRDSARLITNIEKALEKNSLDFNKLDGFMHQFKGSSSSIGAKKVKAECTLFREYCRAGNGEGLPHLSVQGLNGFAWIHTSCRCTRTFQQIKKEYATLKRKLEAYFQVVRQAGPAETACWPK
ncbi:HISTIDINE-CONTAINING PHOSPHOTRANSFER PROTEIN 4 [Salix purpurea]|uniref:Histidine-containing phosphotransfer protein n=1 Tax=Salix purpurea TaxID=77065 RepID=A0A9Q0YVF6_SALPP|nr:HISTIDINE-CONTAINING PHOSPHOTRANSFER PROTEIN 4 [Salix purpurea]